MPKYKSYITKATTHQRFNILRGAVAKKLHKHMSVDTFFNWLADNKKAILEIAKK